MYSLSTPLSLSLPFMLLTFPRCLSMCRPRRRPFPQISRTPSELDKDHSVRSHQITSWPIVYRSCLGASNQRLWDFEEHGDGDAWHFFDCEEELARTQAHLLYEVIETPEVSLLFLFILSTQAISEEGWQALGPRSASMVVLFFDWICKAQFQEDLELMVFLKVYHRSLPKYCHIKETHFSKSQTLHLPGVAIETFLDFGALARELYLFSSRFLLFFQSLFKQSSQGLFVRAHSGALSFAPRLGMFWYVGSWPQQCRCVETNQIVQKTRIDSVDCHGLCMDFFAVDTRLILLRFFRGFAGQSIP